MLPTIFQTAPVAFPMAPVAFKRLKFRTHGPGEPRSLTSGASQTVAAEALTANTLPLIDCSAFLPSTKKANWDPTGFEPGHKNNHNQPSQIDLRELGLSLQRLSISPSNHLSEITDRPP